ncbi:MAG: tRNA lysidine(34) synthetase TilS [Gammaproteobacteria bacterium]|nr:tRNA lysidine(34) synthetase TilS [Gammaproteobacteria bacterium]
MSLDAAQLLDAVLALAPDAGGYWVAYSGGCDSHVLLHALAAGRERLPAPLGAMHVNHNLQSDAVAWAAHCGAVCAALGVACRDLSVQAHARAGESPEAAARAARYRALAEALPPGHVLLTAHHQDDQAETLLLQLLRGAGPKGLAAMPAAVALGPGRLLRPLLDVSQAALRAYADRHGLAWVEDPSNARLDYDRNFLRQRVLPLLRERWPALGAVLARGAAHQADAAQLLDELAALDLADAPSPSASPVAVENRAAAASGEGAGDTDRGIGRNGPRYRDDALGEGSAAVSGAAIPLPVSRLLALSGPRRANLLRHWLHGQHAPTPSAAVLARIDHDVLQAAADAQPCVVWGGVRLRRYRDRLFLDREPSTAADEAAVGALDWSASGPLTLPGGVLMPLPTVGAGVARHHLDGLAGGRLQVRFRGGGERLRPAGRREHHRLKHLLQEAGVPPWERARVPLIYCDDHLVAVAGLWVCEGFQAAPDEPGVTFVWHRAIVPAGAFW